MLGIDVLAGYILCYQFYGQDPGQADPDGGGLH